MFSGTAESVISGGFPAWRLPSDERCAAFARGLVKAVFGTLGIRRDVTYDMALAISELATNVHVHAHTDSQAWPEIWAYRTWGPRPEVVLKVYDSAPWHGPFPAPASDPDAEGGRGLELVQALTAERGGRWGVHRTRSRLGAVQAPGKAVYVAVPLPRELRRVRPVSPRQAADELYRLLAERTLGRLNGSCGYGMAVICVRAGIHAWIRPDSISYTIPGQGTQRHVLGDGIEVAEQLVRHCTDLDAASMVSQEQP